MAKKKKTETEQGQAPKKRGRPPGSGKKKEAEPKRDPIAHRYNSPVDEESKALFLQTLPKIADLKAKLNTANANLRNAYKTAKKDGFLKSDFEVAFQLQTAEGEKAKKTAIARDLTIAKWMGYQIGSQLDLFAGDVEARPIADRAYDEGVEASMKGESAKPVYDPGTQAYDAFMKGFHDDQEKRINKGIKKLESEPDISADEEEEGAKVNPAAGLITEDQKAAAAGHETDYPDQRRRVPRPQAENAGEDYAGDASDLPGAPSSGIPMTRSQFAARQQQQQQASAGAEGTGLFTKKN